MLGIDEDGGYILHDGRHLAAPLRSGPGLIVLPVRLFAKIEFRVAIAHLTKTGREILGIAPEKFERFGPFGEDRDGHMAVFRCEQHPDLAQFFGIKADFDLGCIGHLGSLTDVMTLSGIATAEMCMADLGLDIKLGSGVAAAQDVYRATPTLSHKDAA